MNNYNISIIHSRSGFLLGEFTLKTILAIISILILISLLATLYATFSQERAREQAASTLSRIFEGIGIATVSEKPFQYVLTEPKSWKMLWYTNGLSSVAECRGVPCLCLCKPARWYGFSNQQENCASAGVCRKLGVAFSMPSEIVIDGPTSIVVQEEGGTVKLVRA